MPRDWIMLNLYRDLNCAEQEIPNRDPAKMYPDDAMWKGKAIWTFSCPQVRNSDHSVSSKSIMYTSYTRKTQMTMELKYVYADTPKDISLS